MSAGVSVTEVPGTSRGRERDAGNVTSALREVADVTIPRQVLGRSCSYAPYRRLNCTTVIKAPGEHARKRHEAHVSLTNVESP